MSGLVGSLDGLEKHRREVRIRPVANWRRPVDTTNARISVLNYFEIARTILRCDASIKISFNRLDPVMNDVV